MRYRRCPATVRGDERGHGATGRPEKAGPLGRRPREDDPRARTSAPDGEPTKAFRGGGWLAAHSRRLLPPRLSLARTGVLIEGQTTHHTNGALGGGDRTFDRLPCGARSRGSPCAPIRAHRIRNGSDQRRRAGARRWAFGCAGLGRVPIRRRRTGWRDDPVVRPGRRPASRASGPRGRGAIFRTSQRRSEDNASCPEAAGRCEGRRRDGDARAHRCGSRRRDGREFWRERRHS